jgi:hypothetical protein
MGGMEEKAGRPRIRCGQAEIFLFILIFLFRWQGSDRSRIEGERLRERGKRKIFTG